MRTDLLGSSKAMVLVLFLFCAVCCFYCGAFRVAKNNNKKKKKQKKTHTHKKKTKKKTKQKKTTKKKQETTNNPIYHIDDTGISFRKFNLCLTENIKTFNLS